MIRNQKKVCLITPNHISTNPRLIKEAMALSEAGYQVHIIFSQHIPEATAMDSGILRNNPEWQFTSLDWSSKTLKARLSRLFSGLLNKTGFLISKQLDWPLMEKVKMNRHYFFQLKAATQSGADLFIAHNAGALPVAADAAQKLKRPFAFDAEDFHRGQLVEKSVCNAIIKLEDCYLKKAAYVSAASPLIGREYDQLYGLSCTVINNVFSRRVDSNPANHLHNGPLKLFWFSQSVGPNRGLQDVFAAMREVDGLDIEFNIFGKLYPETKSVFDQVLQNLHFRTKPKIIFHGTLSPEKLLEVAADYDVGLAIEPGFCRNNEIALSNKIFTYLLGGNAIIFSGTPAQSQFFENHPGLGFLYSSSDVVTLASFLHQYYYDRQLLKTHQLNSKRLFEEKYNWNIVKRLFLELVEKTV